MRKNFSTFILLASFLIMLSNLAEAGIIERIKNAYGNFKARMQKKEAVVKKEEPRREPQPKITKEIKMTKEEVIAELKDELATEDEVFDMIPELKPIKDESGNIYYTYRGAKIEDMVAEDLEKLLSRVRQILVKIRTDRIQAQLETVRQVQRTQAVSRGAATYAPPQPPRTPAVPASAPKVPSAPPSTRR